MSYIIRHPAFGVYTKHELAPRFTWKRKVLEGKKFPTEAAALKLIGDLPGLEACTVEPLKESK